MNNALLDIKNTLKRELLVRGILSSDPRTLNIFTTDRCNFSCFYCSRNILDESPDSEYRYDDKSEFHTEDLRLLLDKYPTIRTVSFVGIGEPFLIRDLIPMAELAKSRRKRTTVISNGSRLHRHWGNIGRLFDDISISLHGLTPLELLQIANVKENVFNQFIENVRYLTREEGPQYPHLRIHATVVFLKQNLKRLREAAEFCFQNSIPELDMHNYLSLGPDARQNVVFDDENEFIDFGHNLVDEYKGRVKITLPVWIKRDDSALKWGCTTFFRYLRVDGLGQVSGCGRIMPPAAANGDFRNELDVFQNDYFTEMRESFRTGKNIPACCRYCPDAQ